MLQPLNYPNSREGNFHSASGELSAWYISQVYNETVRSNKCQRLINGVKSLEYIQIQRHFKSNLTTAGSSNKINHHRNVPTHITMSLKDSLLNTNNRLETISKALTLMLVLKKIKESAVTVQCK